MELLTEIFTWATGLIDSLTELATDSPITYLIIFAMSAIDVIVPLLPAEATVTAAAVLAGQGKLNVVWIMVAAGLGAFLGDNIAYWIGRAAGRPLVQKVLRGNTKQLDNVQAQFDRRGGMFVIIGRFIPGGRTAVAVGAGILHFNWVQFVIYDAIAAVIWAFQAALPGFIGGSLIQDRPWLAMLFGFVLSALMAGGIALAQHRWEHRKSGDGEDAVLIQPAVVGIGRVDAKLGPHSSSAEDAEGPSDQ
ncbi:MAG: DedA family protein [Chloroflexota bacterium]|nr:DedA family protein [Chloroflexota bacterium]